MTLIETLFPLGWQHYLLGGLTIGAGVALLYLFNGWVGGMSSVFSSSWSFVSKRAFFQQARFVSTRNWRLVYALGVVLGALVWRFALAGGEAQHTSVPAWQLLVGGFLVGYGARLGNGCTSGHGICGLGALQLPSLGAVLTALTAAHPDLREQIFEADGTLRRWVNVYVDGADVRHLAGLETPTQDGIEVVILPAMAGGAPSLFRLR